MLSKEELTKCAGQLSENVRKKIPLIHNLTNYVTVNDVANAQLAIGASPVMADAIEEIEDMASIANAININIGTLNNRTIVSFTAAGKAANKMKKPLVFDPVGAGASTLRNTCAKEFLTDITPSVIRGNISEIAFIAGLDAQSKGVDAGQVNAQMSATEIAQTVAEQHNCVCAITGKTDVISNGKRSFLVKNGTEKMSKITGTGCMCDGLIAAFIASIDNLGEHHTTNECSTDADGNLGEHHTTNDANTTSNSDAADTACSTLENNSYIDNLALATTAAIASMGIAGQLAKRDLEALGAMVGTGSLRVGIIDRLSLLNTDDYRLWADIEEVAQ